MFKYTAVKPWYHSWKPALATLAALSMALAAMPAELLAQEKSSQKTVVGSVEEVVLLPWGIVLPARVDTGAARTSLGAQELKTAGEVAEFKLRDSVGGHELRLPILDWRVYKTSEGTDWRPIVEIELCIGRKRLLTRVNLNQRGHLKYPLLIGRGLLTQGHFLVDVTRSRTMKPDCGTTSEQGSVPPVSTPGK